jgi:negative regulator of flagellin synthesis FlgM
MSDELNRVIVMSIDINGVNLNNQDPLRGKRSEQRSGTAPEATQPAASEPQNKTDSTKVSLSNAAQAIQQAEADLKGGSEVNEQRVAELRSAIADGSYKSNPQNMAQKMLDLE